MAKFKYQPVPVNEGHAPRAAAPSHEALPKVIGAGIAAIIVVILLTTTVGGTSAPAPDAVATAAETDAFRAQGGYADAPAYVPASHAADDDDRGVLYAPPPVAAPAPAPAQAQTPAPAPAPTTAPAQMRGSAVTDPDAYCASHRLEQLSRHNANIMECAPGDDCRMGRDHRYESVGQKGITLWMTGLSGSGKTTIGRALEEELLKQGKHVYRLDGDNLRGGLNADLGLSSADRDENVRRAAEVAALFSDAGVITIAGLISPMRESRAAARAIHEARGIPFYEVYMDITVDDARQRDPKGLYAKADKGEIKGFTGIDAPYEAPVNPEVSLPNSKISIAECVRRLMEALRDAGVLTGGPAPQHGLLPPDGGEAVNQIVPEHELAAKKAEAETLPSVLLTDVDINWLQTIGEGWMAPQKGFMREGVLLQTLHFKSLLVDEFDLVGKQHVNEEATNMISYGERPNARVSSPIPIVLPITGYTKALVGEAKAVALVNKFGERLAILRDPEVYANRKEEIINRVWGALDPEHPYQKQILNGGDWLMGGEVELLGRITYNDGLDKYRLTAEELVSEFERKGADSVFAFQTRNPTHAGHAYLMQTGRKQLIAKGHRNPVLWLSPLGGYTKSDDVPLDVRVTQHEAIIKAGMLDEATTVLAIWPAPMIYAGPTEVIAHAKSRRVAGASYFVAGRDPAGMKFSTSFESPLGDRSAFAPDDDIYDPDHGRYVLTTSPGMGDMEILSFQMVEYNKKTHQMEVPDPSLPADQYLKISGSKMRALGRMGASKCTSDNYPDPLTCVPVGFMADEGWDIVTDYYMHQADADRTWIGWSRQLGRQPRVSHHASAAGTFGTSDFKVFLTDEGGKTLSPWHDVPLRTADGLYNMVVEISAGTTAKMEIQKGVAGNPIMQDTNDDGSARYYTYGSPEFNYGAFPQTWEDPAEGAVYAGDNDPLDVIEIGSRSLAMGKVAAVRVLGSLELIDSGETDHKIIAINDRDELFSTVRSMEDLERAKPGITARLVDWLTLYKTTDGKPPGMLENDNKPLSAAQAEAIIDETEGYYVNAVRSNRLSAQGFWVLDDDAI